jgi:adhesin transport system membrane fusion protein
MSASGIFNEDDLSYMPDVHRAARRRGRRFAYILSLATVLFFMVMLIWADRAVLDEVTRGEGKVIPSTKTQVIQNLEGGILAELSVREGDIVQEGAVLVRIDNTMARANFRDLRGQYLALVAEAVRLQAMISGAQSVSFPDEVLKDAPEEASAQTHLFEAQRRQIEAQIAVLESQKNQRQQEIKEAQSKRAQLSGSLRLAREELAITEPLVRKSLLPRLDLIRIERQVSDLEGEIRTINATIPRLETAHAEAENRIQELVVSTRAEMSNELREVRSRSHSVSETLLASGDRVTRTEVRSPVYGTVKQIKFNTLGGVIQPGEDIMEIVPLDDTLLIEAQVRPADIAFLRPGQKAIIKVSAYDFSIYGGLAATLEQISADTIKDERGDPFYRVYLRTTENALSRHGEALPIIPGMTATAEILTGEKSVLDYLLKPLLKAKDRALSER